MSGHCLGHNALMVESKREKNANAFNASARTWHIVMSDPIQLASASHIWPRGNQWVRMHLPPIGKHSNRGEELVLVNNQNNLCI